MKNILRTIKLLIFKVCFSLKCLSGREKVFLFHVPINSNMGDQAIIYAEKKFVNQYLPKHKWIEIPYYLEDRAFDFIVNKIKPNDLILIQGGGSLGDLYIKEEMRTQKIVGTFVNNKIIIMPQTITYRDSAESDQLKKRAIEVFSKHPNLTICAREKISYHIMLELFSNNNVLLVPDIVLFLTYPEKNKRKNQVLLLLRHDFEKRVKAEEIDQIIKDLEQKNISYCLYDTFLDDYLYIKKTYSFLRKRRIYKLLKKCANSKLIITDRLHGMVFAALTHTPCYVFENLNHKIRGVYDWISDLEAIKLVSRAKDIDLNILEQHFEWPLENKLLPEFQKLIDELEKK